MIPIFSIRTVIDCLPMKSPNHIVKKVTSMDNDTRTLLNLTDPHLNFPHHWLKYK